jgi:uncharacterized protein YkwD
MSRGKKILYFILFAILLGTIYAKPRIEDLFLKYEQKISDFSKSAQQLVTEKIERSVSTPPPLRAETESPSAKLTKVGTIQWTNLNRRDNGLPALKGNQKLDMAALKKAQDMFDKQYFEHISPDGKGPQDLADMVVYSYLSIGENLALGNFANDKELLDAWMASPGHRENILNKGFTEIGVAVLPGRYEGKDTWIAVQEFGSPISLCPTVDSSLKNEIEDNNKKIATLSTSLAKKRNNINSTKSSDPDLSQEIENYNALVKEYNNLLAQTKKLVENYNGQVNDFNQCVKDKTQ